jgi:hypothetical protein
MSKRDSLRRRPPFRAPLPHILIVCEGKRTEPGYFRGLKASQRIPVTISFVQESNPQVLVAEATRIQRDPREAGKYDEIWCVFDMDEHARFEEALRHAKDNEIRTAISNPCFELWILLHFQDQRAAIKTSAAHKACQKYLPGYQKTIPCEKLLPHFEEAAKRASELEGWQQAQGRPGANPSTEVHHLVQRLMKIRKESGFPC